MTPLRKRMIENMELHGFADRTQESYVAAVAHLAKYYNRPPDQLSADEIRRFFLHLIKEKQAAKSTVTIHLCGIKFFFEKTLGRQMPVLDLVRPKRRKKLPAVLSTEEVRRILSLLTHPTARMALTMIYSCGLRLSEGTHLRVEDVDLDRRTVRVSGKGGKDRYVPLARRPMMLLQSYQTTHPSATWLFTGRNKQPVSERHLAKSVQSSASKKRHPQKSVDPYVASFICNAPARTRHRCGNHPEDPRSQIRLYHHNLHPFDPDTYQHAPYNCRPDHD